MLGKCRAAHESVETIARIVAMQGNEAIIALARQLAFDQLHLWPRRAAPELAIEILARARMTRAVLVTGRIAQRVKMDLVLPRERRHGFKRADQIAQRVHARGFVPMNARKDGEFDRRFLA